MMASWSTAERDNACEHKGWTGALNNVYSEDEGESPHLGPFRSTQDVLPKQPSWSYPAIAQMHPQHTASMCQEILEFSNSK
jgi:hypothetical protein